MANKCEGACPEHRGSVERVEVVHKSSGKKWGEFWYCDVARQEDRQRGFFVTLIHDRGIPQ